MESIYLDSAATTKPKQEVVDAMMPYLIGDRWHNPSSAYAAGARVKQDIEDARKTVADFIGAETKEIVFCSTGSESNCTAIRGFVDWAKANLYRPVVVTTKIEHKSIMSCVDAFRDGDVIVDKLDVDEGGYVDVDGLDKVLESYHSLALTKVLVSIQFANSEIGTIQPMKEISRIVHKHGAILHTDAVQAFGKIPINVQELGIDMMTASGHKIGTPRGVSLLYKKKDVKIRPLVFGSQEMGLRGGTENSAGIVGLAKAIELAKDDVKGVARLALVRDYLIGKLESIGCKLNGARDNRLPNNVNVQTGVNGESLLLMADMSGFMVSTGSACNSRVLEPSHVLVALGHSDEVANSSIRITISNDITMDQIDYVVDELERCIKLIKGQTLGWQKEV